LSNRIKTTDNVDEYQVHLVDLALAVYNIDIEYDFDSPDIENQLEQRLRQLRKISLFNKLTHETYRMHRVDIVGKQI
jgi:hypothetical protein